MQKLSGAWLLLLVAACALAGAFADLNEGEINQPELSSDANITVFSTKCNLRSGCHQGRHYYIETSRQRTRDDAARYCTALNMELLSVENCGEDAFITNLLKSQPNCGNKNYWISASHNGNKDWSWINGAPLNYTNWKLNEPNYRKDEYCAQYCYNVLQWNDEPCSKKSYFICESNNACS